MVDLSFIAHRALVTMGGLEHEDFPTGVILGFFETLRYICFDPRIRSNKVAICCDSRQSYRRRIFPDYKRKRQEKRTPEEFAALIVMHQQMDLLTEKVLPDVGFCVHRQTGCESDDIMAQIAKQIDKGDDKTGVMITSDGDLYQCINRTVHWYDPNRNLYLDHLGLWAKKGVEPDEWADVKAIAGCHGDEVPGVPGVGEKSAILYIHKQHKASHKRYQAIETPEGRAIIERNDKLVRLPFPKTRPVELVDPVYKPAAFFKWCEKLGLTSSLGGGRRKAWDLFFAGEMNNGRQVAREPSRRVPPTIKEDGEEASGQMSLF